MSPAQLPPNETARLAALHQCRILDTSPETSYDDITRLATQICQTPIALVSLIDTDRQWFKSKVGLVVAQTSRDIAFCAHAILHSSLLIVPDTLADERFADNPLVTSEPYLRFYAGVPLLTAEGYTLGTLCVADHIPRQLNAEQIDGLQVLARQAMQMLELRRNLKDLERTLIKRQASGTKREQFLTRVAVGLGIAAAVLLTAGGIPYYSVSRLTQAANSATARQQVLGCLDSLLIEFSTLEASQQHYLQTGTQPALDEYQTALTTFALDLEQLRTLTADNPKQQRRIDVIDRLMNQIAAESETAIAQSSTHRSAPNSVYSTIVRRTISEMEQEEATVLERWSQMIETTLRQVTRDFLHGAILNAVILLLIFLLIVREITKRQQTEEMLESERDFTAAVLDTVGALVIVLNPQGQIVRFNQDCEKTTGYNFAEVRHKPFWDLFYRTEEVGAVKQRFADMLAGHFPCRYERRWLTKSKHVRLIDWSNTAIVDHDGVVRYIIGTGIDITERRQAEIALQQVEENYRSIVENAIEGISQTTLDGRYLSANQALARIYGYDSPADLIANLTDIPNQLYVNPLNWHEFAHRMQQQGTISGFESQVHRQDGTAIWISESSRLVKAADGTPLYYESTLADITDRKRAEEEIQRQNQRSQLLSTIALRIRQSLDLQSILSTTVAEVREFLQTDRVLVYRFAPDWDGTVVAESVNSGYSSLLGIPIHDTCFQQGAWQSYCDGTVRAMNDIAQANLTPCYQNLLVRYQVRANLVVPLLESDRLWGLLIAHQCSEPRQWQPFEIDFLAQLANQVSIAIAQAQQNMALEAARQTAEQATAAKSTFLAMMSHEIRTPMNAVLGMTGLLAETQLNAEQHDFVETIRTSGDHLLALINSILDFSKLEAHEMEPETLNFDVSNCAEDVVDLLAAAAHLKGLEIVTLIDPKVPTQVRGDLGRLRQILTNLVSNAIKFTEFGEVVIRMSLQAETTSHASILFSVDDTGVGIPAADHPKLFQPFSQVDASTTRRYGGTGLGLAICKQLVDLMGGRIGLHSQAGQGAQFWFTIPFEKQLEPPQPSQPERHQFTGLKLLLVDANQLNRQAVQQQTAGSGMFVDEADNATIALDAVSRAIAQGNPYDIVMLDAQLLETQTNGSSRSLEANLASSSAKLVLMTTLNHLGKNKQFIETTQARCLTKPIRKSRLINCLTEVLHLKPPNSLVQQNSLNSNPIQNPPQYLEPKTIKILLAEDSLVNQKVAINQLQRLNYTVDVAATGQEVLDRLSQYKYDLILMDCQMPILDGYDTTKAIRKLEENQHIIIIAMTANALKEDRKRCLDVGMDDYISKPINKADLASKLSYWEQVILTSNPLVAVHSTTLHSGLKSDAGKANSSIDWNYLRQISGGDPAFEFELLQALVETLPFHLQTLSDNIAAQNFGGMEQEAHYIKGTSASAGARQLEKISVQLEAAAQQQRLTTVEGLFELMKQDLTQIQLLLDTKPQANKTWSISDSCGYRHCVDS
ncbi:PAS domain S-box protein [Oculatella sp. LEGE 06141]|uniref:GAF domain-containing protein n=1 Tax=Oculatella sp. LEGE 06141 TaxID=1828648 RepID=UPI001882491B|nr:GAF domain-containing protein [Oculatella sp. LEGE 06141]MBE9179611.1 PAS domain S-box protein [Oculatella sp. LEGE 06141]